ncbi:MAG: bifunctional class I SAM-dependent methyltransferase/glycosyltransferase family 2 protein [Bacteroidetes bacterium]|nr:bifunctional class I SAM-dependent methyltransferase/glycosyltransferase family 2 protein [Bacteroidota bacterium]
MPIDNISLKNSEESLAYFEERAKSQRAYRRRRSYYWNEITKYCDYFSHENISVLEVGCGTGELLAEIKAKRKVGIDFSPSMITQAKEQFPSLEFQVMAAEDIKLNEKFDLIIISNLINHVGDVQQVFDQLRNVCHDRTKVIVTYYNYLWQPVLNFFEWVGLKKKTPPQNWLSNNDVNNLLYLAGFDVYRTTMRMLMPLNIPLIAPLLNRYIGRMPFIRHLCLNLYSFAKVINATPRVDFEKKYTTSVVIPARNESGNIEDAILRLPKFGKDVEIIFVEGNSTDDTWDTIQKMAEKYKGSHNIKIARQDGKGKGDAVRKGFGIATGDILMILDADLTVPPEDIPKFYDAIASGNGDFINGCRLIYKMEKNAMRPLNLLGNKFFSIAFSFLLERPYKDTLCGTKVLFRDDYEKLIINRKFFGDFDPFGDFDLIFGAYKLNLKTVELPIRYRERTYGDTNISRFKHGFILLQMTLFAARKIKFI